MSTSVPNSSTLFVLYLSKEGDSVRIDRAPIQEDVCFKSALADDAESCKTHEQVLNFLQKLASSERAKSNYQFFHENNISYEKHSGHSSNPTAQHACSLDTQISFIKYKILEQEHGARDSSQNTWCTLL